VSNLKELLSTCEKSLNRKDDIIMNLTRALQTHKDKLQMSHALTQWKLKLIDERRQAFTMKLASQHHNRCLLKSAWASWRSVVESNWREKVEKACQRKAQEVCAQLSREMDEKINKINEELKASRAENLRLQNEKVSYEENMKKAFMRGVCALNLEAMTMFDGENSDNLQREIENLASVAADLPQKPQHHQHLQKKKAPKQQQPASILKPTSVENYSTVTTAAAYQNPPATTVLKQGVRNFTYQDIPGPDALSKTSKKLSSTQQQQNQHPPSVGFTNQPSLPKDLIHSSSTSSRYAKARPVSVMNKNGTSVLVQRHHPNLQSAVQEKNLHHVVKHPNTATNIIPPAAVKRSNY